MMTTVQSQAMFQSIPAAVAMDIDPADFVEAENCHSSSSSSFNCRAHINGVCTTARAGIEEVHHVLQQQEEEEEEEEEDEANGEREEEERRGSFMQLQASVSAATGECGNALAQEGEVAGCMAGSEPGPQERGHQETSLGQVGGSDENETRAALASEAAEGGGSGGELPFSKHLISFSLFGKLPAKSKRPWTESLSARIAEVQDTFKNIPQMLYFAPSSIALDGIGVYAAETLPKDTLLGPYLGKTVRKELVESDQNNQWLWEVHEEDCLSHFIDARDPKYGNWMNYIQSARHCEEQNLRVAQYSANLYFVVTQDVKVGEELLVWYDQDQYHLYMGLPTRFHAVTPPSLFLEHQQQQQHVVEHQQQVVEQMQQHGCNNTNTSSSMVVHSSHTSSSTSSPSSSSTSSPRHPSHPSAGGILAQPPPPPYPSCHSNSSVASFPGNGSGLGAVRGGSYSDGACTDDSGISIDTNGGPTPPLTATFDLTASRRLEVCKDLSPFSGSMLPGETAGTVNTTELQVIPSARLLPGTIEFHNPPERAVGSTGNAMHYTGSLMEAVPVPPEGGLSWGIGLGTTVHTITSSPSSEPQLVKLVPSSTVEDQNLAIGTGMEAPPVWGTGTQHYVESPTSVAGGLGGFQSPLNKKQLLYGMFSRSEDGSRWHCEECKRLFSSQGSLRAHARIHTGERPYQCQYCFRTFCQASTLRSHERLHTGEKPYKCEECGRAFTQSAGLRSHRKTHRYDS